MMSVILTKIQLAVLPIVMAVPTLPLTIIRRRTITLRQIIILRQAVEASAVMELAHHLKTQVIVLKIAAEAPPLSATTP